MSFPLAAWLSRHSTRSYGHLVCSMDIRYILWSFGKYFQFLVYCPKNNLATLTMVCVCSR
jgi:hypothetical protein